MIINNHDPIKIDFRAKTKPKIKSILIVLVSGKYGFLSNMTLKKKDFCSLHMAQSLKKMHFIYKKTERGNVFLAFFLEISWFCIFLEIYNKFIKFLKDFVNISITLKKHFL